MSFLGKVYTYQRHENFDAWLKTLGLPDDKIAAIVADKTTQKYEKKGDSYVVTQTNSKGIKETTFQSGVEFDDTIGDDKMPIKTTITVGDNSVTQVMNGPQGCVTFKREYDGDNSVVYITSDKYDGDVVKRIYKIES